MQRILNQHSCLSIVFAALCLLLALMPASFSFAGEPARLETLRVQGDYTYLVILISIIGTSLLISIIWSVLLKRQVQNRTQALKQELEERKRTESRLKEQESLLRATLESSHDGILVVSDQGEITEYNARFLEMWSVTEDFMQNHNATDLLRQIRPQLVDFREFVACVERLYNQDGHSQDTIEMVDGRVMERESYPLIQHNQVTGRVWVFQDMTERVRYLEKIEKGEKRFQIALEAGPDPIVLYDMQGRVTFLNQAFTRTFGWKLEERLDRKLDDFVPEENWEETRRMILRVMEGRSISGFETYRRTKDGRILPVLLSASIFKDKAGRPEGSIITLKDMSENKQLQAELQHSHKMEAIGTLAGGIAHDFNNILAAISGNAELGLYQKDKTERSSRYFTAILNACQRARDLVQQILSFSRQEKSEKQFLQPARVVEDVLRLLRATTPANIDIQTRVDGKKYILADSVQIHQVLMNLCTNAVYAMRETGGMLTIEVDEVTLDTGDKRLVPGKLPPGCYLRLQVADTGHGIPEDIRDRIFEPFFTTKGVGEGTGMGLSMVHGIVCKTGGTITVDSRVSAGTCFTIYLPAKDYQEGGSSVEIDAAVFGGSERILFVDDEELIVESWQEILSTLGYRVTGCSDSLEALAMFQKTPDDYDMLITDMTMPGITGDLLAIKAKTIKPDLKVILCSGYSAIMDSEKAHQIGIDGFAMKPLLKRNLAEKIREVFDND